MVIEFEIWLRMWWIEILKVLVMELDENEIKERLKLQHGVISNGIHW